MLTFIGITLILLFQPNAATDLGQLLATYPKVDAYEVRPGILLLPSYTTGGEVCALGLQTLHYTPDMVRLDPDMTGQGVDKILDELVPSAERGEPSADIPRGLYTRSGQSLVYTRQYENVTLQYWWEITSPPERKSKKNGTDGNLVAVTVKWKHRTCR